jgi:transmembrane sensor
MADKDRLTEAIEWRIRLRNGGAADWDAFVLWLEEDPARSEAYDLVSIADAGLDEAAIPAVPSAPLPLANDDWSDIPAGRPAARLFVAAIAAVAAVLLVAFLVLPRPSADSSPYAVATRPGEQRVVALAGGGSVALNGSTRLLLDSQNPRYAELVSGEAAFTVRHDSARPFTVVAGGHRVQDAGTVFNVVREQDGLSVEVAEGSILFDPRGAALTLGAGETLAVRGSKGNVVRDRMSPAAVAGWRRGQLSYRRAPLAAVARGLSRSMGMDIVVDPAIAERPFTGTIRIDAEPSRTMARLAAALGLQARRTGAGWTIEPPRRAHH